MCEAPVAAYNAGFLPVDGCGYGTDIICVQVYLGGVDVVSDQDGNSSAKSGSVPSGGKGESFYVEIGVLCWFGFI